MVVICWWKNYIGLVVIVYLFLFFKVLLKRVIIFNLVYKIKVDVLVFRWISDNGFDCYWLFIFYFQVCFNGVRIVKIFVGYIFGKYQCIFVGYGVVQVFGDQFIIKYFKEGRISKDVIFISCIIIMYK